MRADSLSRSRRRTLSHRLGHLRAAGLVFSQRSGKCIPYEAAEPRVRYQRHEGGRFSLTSPPRGSGVAVTRAAGDSGVKIELHK